MTALIIGVVVVSDIENIFTRHVQSVETSSTCVSWREKKEMQQERKPTSEKLTEALQAANAPQYMIEQAQTGFYDDYQSPIAAPIMVLVRDAQRYGLTDIVQRAMAGEFDGQKWEAEDWENSPEGQVILSEFLKPKSPKRRK
jgi:hypothetical protein